MTAYIFTIIAVLCGVIALGCGGATAYKWFIKGANIKRRSPIISAIALALAIITAIPAALMWPESAAPETVNADNPGWSINVDDVDVNMSGFGTKAQILRYLREGFGDKFDEVMTSLSEYDFLAIAADGNPVDQAKILANKDYLKAIGYGKEYPDGFRNAVAFPSKVFTAEVYNDLANKTPEELEELYNQHRWLDVNWLTMTSLRFADMRLQRMEHFPEFNAQNTMWAPALREILNHAKEDETYLNSLYVTDADGNPQHIIEEVQIYLGMLCLSEENAVITGIEAPKSTVNWELPSLNPEQESRWTVMLDQPDQQEELPSVIWTYPSLKSGLNVYKTGYNTTDLRSEEFNPKEEPVKPATPPSNPPTTPTDPVPTNPVKRTITAHYQELGTGATISPDTSHSFVVGKSFSVSPKEIPGWTYNSSKGTTSGSSMPDNNSEVWFYYTKNPDTTLAALTVEHRDVDSNALLRSDGPYKVTKGSEQTVSADYSGDGYVYLNNNQGNSKSTIKVTVNGDMTVIFYYYKEYQVTARYVDWDTKQEIHSPTPSYWRQGSTYSVSALTISGYTYYRNDRGNSNQTVTGTTPANNNTVVTFYYKQNAQSFTVTTLYKAVDSNHTLDTDTQTVKAGDQYTTSSKNIPGYRYVYQSGDAASGRMPERNVTVIYWYELIEQDGNGDKNGDANPGNNGTGNATEGIGPGKGEEDHYIPPTITDTDKQQGNEPTSNHKPTDNPGGQAAGSDNRQEVGTGTTEGVIGDNQNTESSGNGGQDKTVTVEGADKTEGATPPPKDVPAENNPGTSTTPNEGGGSTTIDISGTENTGTLDFVP